MLVILGMFDKGATGAVADDQYHRFEQDVKMMKNVIAALLCMTAFLFLSQTLDTVSCANVY